MDSPTLRLQNGTCATVEHSTFRNLTLLADGGTAAAAAGSAVTALTGCGLLLLVCPLQLPWPLWLPPTAAAALLTLGRYSQTLDIAREGAHPCQDKVRPNKRKPMLSGQCRICCSI